MMAVAETVMPTSSQISVGRGCQPSSAISVAISLPQSMPRNSEAKDRPPLNPVPIERMTARAFSTSTPASSHQNASWAKRFCKAERPEDSAAGLARASMASPAPPTTGASQAGMIARSRVSTRVQQRMTVIAMATVAKVIIRIMTTAEGPRDNAGTSKCRADG